MRIQDLINTFNELKIAGSHQAAIGIFKLLDNNSALFIKHLDPDTFQSLHARFEAHAYATAKEYNSENFKTELEKSCGLLSFYLDRVI